VEDTADAVHGDGLLKEVIEQVPEGAFLLQDAAAWASRIFQHERYCDLWEEGIELMPVIAGGGAEVVPFHARLIILH